MKPLFIFLLIAVSITCLQAQVGFNNPNPDPSSILDLTANDKGLLTPRMTKSLREAIVSPAIGLLVYELPANSPVADDNGNVGGFFYYTSGGWIKLNHQWTRVGNTNDVALSGNASVTGAISAGTVSATNLSVPGFANNALVPTGVIVMWSGLLTSIPAGWALCDGSVVGRPDLRDRFIVGGGSSYGVGTTGGQNTVTLSVNQLPPHSHGVNDPGHSHPTTYILTSATGDGGKRLLSSNFNNYGSAVLSSDAATTGISIQNTGSGQAIDVRPRYYSLAYIIKL
jgi:microcystin-dependent protein